MNYSKTIVCLANSRKPGGRCVAGKTVDGVASGEWIRPVSARSSAEISSEERQYQNGQEAEILEIVEIPMIAHVPRVHQTENHMIDANFYWSRQGALTWVDLRALVDEPLSLWENGDSTYHGSNDRVTHDVAARFHNSLLLIKPQNVSIRVLAPGAAFGNPKRKVRAAFRYQATYYDLMVTDIQNEKAFLAKPDGTYPIDQDVFFCISLAEGHGDGYCYKLAAAVFSAQPLGGV